MESYNIEKAVAYLNACNFSIPRYLCEKFKMFGGGHLFLTPKQHEGEGFHSPNIRGTDHVLLEDRQERDNGFNVGPHKIRPDHLFSASMKAWLLAPIHTHICKEVLRLPGARDENMGVQSLVSEVGFKVNSLGFPENNFQNNTIRQGPTGRAHWAQKDKQPRSPDTPSMRTPDELIKQVDLYANQVMELRERLDSMQQSLQLEEDRRICAEQQAHDLRENLSHELIEAQRHRAELRAKLDGEQQERAKFGARLAVLSETVAQGYTQGSNREKGTMSGMLDPQEYQLVSQLREAKRWRGVAEGRIESLKAQVKQLEVMCDSVKTFQKVCQHRESAWRYGLLTVVQAALICLAVCVVFGRDPEIVSTLLPT